MDEENREDETQDVEGHALGVDDPADEDESRRRRLNEGEGEDEDEGDPGRRRR